MLLTSYQINPAEFEARTGWALKPEGACKGELCVPLPSMDARAVSERLGMALVEDEQRHLIALGPETLTGKALTTAEAPDLSLKDKDGNGFELRSLRGQKVLLLAWASW